METFIILLIIAFTVVVLWSIYDDAKLEHGLKQREILMEAVHAYRLDVIRSTTFAADRLKFDDIQFNYLVGYDDIEDVYKMCKHFWIKSPKQLISEDKYLIIEKYIRR